MRSAALTILLVGTMVGSSCGGGSSTATVTVSPPPGSSAPASTTAPSPTDELAAYLAKFQTARSPLAHAKAEYTAATKGLTDTPDANWIKAGRSLDRIANKVDRASLAIAALTPPHGMAAAHQAYVNGSQLVEQAIRQLATDLKSRDASTLASDVSPVKAQLAHAKTLLNRWRVAVIVAANRLDVPIPPWVRKTGY